MASGPGTRCRFSGGLSPISRMRCTTAVCEVREAGGVRRSRERACKAITSPGAASCKRLSHFLTQARDLPRAVARSWCVQLGCCCASQRKLAARSIGLRFPCHVPPLWVVVFLKCSARAPGRKDTRRQRERKTHEAKGRGCWKSLEKLLK
jgi:hypothetical protein